MHPDYVTTPEPERVRQGKPRPKTGSHFDKSLTNREKRRARVRQLTGFYGTDDNPWVRKVIRGRRKAMKGRKTRRAQTYHSNR